MNQYLEQLINLSNLDKKIDSYSPLIEEINKDLIIKQTQIDSLKLQISNLDDEILDLNSQINNTELHITEFSNKLKDLSSKQNTIKTERELKAISIEQDIAKDQLSAANEEIERLQRIIESKLSIKSELNLSLNSLEQELNSMSLSLKDKIKTIEDERNKVCQQKEQLLSQMNQKIIAFYEKIRKWAKNTSVVPVRKQACYGCFMKINDKTYSSVLQAKDIITCPHCGRILFKEVE